MSKYPKKENETFEEYCHRLCSEIKEKDNISWRQLATIINSEWDVFHDESYYRKKEKNYQEVKEYTGKNFSQYLEMKKLKVKLSDERTQVNALVRTLSREETLKEIAIEVADKLSTKKSLVINPPLIERSIFENYGLLLIGDWHYGIEINNEFNTYNPTIAVERIKKLLDKVIQKCDDLNLKDLTVVNLGDMIAGNIHLPLRLNSRIDVLTQVFEVSELLSEFLAELASRYNITYCSVMDNHSRIEPRKNDSIDLESLCRITDWYIQTRLPQITIQSNQLSKDICSIKRLGHSISFVHGHKDSPNTAIQKLNTFIGERQDLICSAHRHHFSADEYCNTMFIANGSLMGTDDYAYNLRLTSPPSQTLIEISKKNVVEGIYRLIIT